MTQTAETIDKLRHAIADLLALMSPPKNDEPLLTIAIRNARKALSDSNPHGSGGAFQRDK